MRFALSDDQAALREATAALLARHASRESARTTLGRGGYDTELWRRLTGELGAAGLAIPPAFGGAGAGHVELAVVLEELGASLASTPYLGTVLAAEVLRAAGEGSAVAARWLAGLAGGTTVATVALPDHAAAGAPPTVHGSVPAGGPASLTGRVAVVVNGAEADLLLVPAGTAEGLAWFAVESAEVRATPLPSLDLTRPLARVDLDGAAASPVPAADPEAVLRRARDVAAVLLAAEQVGTARACLDMAVAHARTRVQFGQPIGAFQAVKHRCADMYVAVESSRALVRHAAWLADSGGDLAAAASATRAYVSDATYRTAAATLQILGGIGYTWDHDAHVHFRRATAATQLLGPPADHRDRVATLIGL